MRREPQAGAGIVDAPPAAIELVEYARLANLCLEAGEVRKLLRVADFENKAVAQLRDLALA